MAYRRTTKTRMKEGENFLNSWLVGTAHKSNNKLQNHLSLSQKCVQNKTEKEIYPEVTFKKGMDHIGWKLDDLSDASHVRPIFGNEIDFAEDEMFHAHEREILSLRIAPLEESHDCFRWSNEL